MAPVCRFYQAGNCRNGDSCRFEHPGAGRGGQSQGQGQGYDRSSSQNRYGALQGGGGGGRGDGRRDGSRGGGGGDGGRGNDPKHPPYRLDRGVILKDLKDERPMWIFSAYGPGTNAPIQLFGGPQREISPEEMRLRHYIAAAQGKEQQAIQEAQVIYAEVDKQNQTAMNDIDGAIKYIIDGEKQHPNRLDMIKDMESQGKTTFGAPTTMPSAFGQPSTGPTFGQPSNPLAQPNANPLAQPSLNPFTAKPGFGGATFGQPTSVGAQPSTFGQPSFGQPNPLGQNANPFTQTSQPSQPPNPPGFGQPTLPASQPNPFAQASQPSTFGQPSQPSNFGRPSQPNPLGQPTQPSTFGQPSQPSTFGQPSQPSAFGQPSQPSTFGQPSNPINPPQQAFNNFVSTTSLTQTVSPLKPTPGIAKVNFARTDSALNPNPTLPTPTLPRQPVGETRKDASGKLVLWHGQPVTYVSPPNNPSTTYPCYKRSDGKIAKIHFPDGRKQAAMWENTGAQAAENLYTEDVKNAYDYASKEGRFRDGLMPEVPPKREWVSWDL